MQRVQNTHQTREWHQHRAMATESCEDSQPLRFCIRRFTSQDSSFPCTNLEPAEDGTQGGWRSERFCAFPQDLDLEFIQTNAIVRQVRMLVHETMVASKIEIFVAKRERQTVGTGTCVPRRKLHDKEDHVCSATSTDRGSTTHPNHRSEAE
jgi:hypothetical protein